MSSFGLGLVRAIRLSVPLFPSLAPFLYTIRRYAWTITLTAAGSFLHIAACNLSLCAHITMINNKAIARGPKTTTTMGIAGIIIILSHRGR